MNRILQRGFLPALLVLAFFLFLAAASYGDTKEKIPFETDDTLEEIRAKIKHNGYDFTVSRNWVFDMPAEQKTRFFSRRASTGRLPKWASQDMGPVLFQLGKTLPASFDWRNHNGHSYIGPIRNQGSCGSCYAFGACAAAEGTYNWATGRYDGNCIDFSESYIIWCLGRLSEYEDHFFGCKGADYDYAELEALTVEGVTTESNFPYRQSDPGSCTHWNDPTIVFESWHRIPCNDIEAIKTAIMTYGVVDAAVYAGNAFEGYNSGIYEDTNTSCSSSPCYDTPTNHAIALVGWNDNNGDGYWILRNSWGTSWGENGYMRIAYTAARVACAAVYLVFGSTAPLAITEIATGLTSDGAVLNGTVNPNGTSTVATFDYGTSAAYGSEATADQSPVSGTGAQAVSAALTGLVPGETYHFRAKAVSAAGTAYGEDKTFIANSPDCPECSGDEVVLTNEVFREGTTCTCRAAVSIAIGADVMIEPGADVTLITPQASLSPYSVFQVGSRVVIRQP